jgi:hypothetical protein
MATLQGAAPVRPVEAELADLVCSDPDLLRAEFEAIIAAAWGGNVPPDGPRQPPAPRPPSPTPPPLTARCPRPRPSQPPAVRRVRPPAGQRAPPSHPTLNNDHRHGEGRHGHHPRSTAQIHQHVRSARRSGPRRHYPGAGPASRTGDPARSSRRHRHRRPGRAGRIPVFKIPRPRHPATGPDSSEPAATTLMATGSRNGAVGGPGRTRTDDVRGVSAALCQLSYRPRRRLTRRQSPPGRPPAGGPGRARSPPAGAGRRRCR